MNGFSLAGDFNEDRSGSVVSLSLYLYLLSVRILLTSTQYLKSSGWDTEQAEIKTMVLLAVCSISSPFSECQGVASELKITSLANSTRHEFKSRR